MRAAPLGPTIDESFPMSDATADTTSSADSSLATPSPAAPIPAPAATESAPATTVESVVTIRHLKKTFRSLSSRKEGGFWPRMRRLFLGTPITVQAVKNLSFDIHRGEVFGLLGPNGSGKSTTIKIMLGLLAPSAGHIEVLGRPPHDVAVKHRIGFLPEESYLYRFLTADETLDFYAKLFNIPKAQRRAKADELIRLVGLEHARSRPLKEYSKGMARRIGLAQALVNDPELIILDEPTTGLDPIGVEEMKQMILRLREAGKTVLLCSHLLADVEEVCDRVAIMCDGDLLAYGPLGDLLQLSDTLEVKLGRASEEFQQKLREFIAHEGVTVTSISKATDSLATLFLRLIDQKDPKKIPAGLREKLLPPAAAETRVG